MSAPNRYRWAVLAAGTAAQAGYSSIQFGVAVMLPALRLEFGLSLAEAGVVVAAATGGAMLSLLAWGVAADRVGERLVATVGLTGAAAALAVAGASVNAASGRAVMHWFGPGERGLALGIRQAAIPIAGAAVALALPHVVT